MSHKAGRDFFRVKRDWSRRKDLVLGQYLVPYLAKIATQNRPVLVVDGFAGPGRFDDGENGSPLIICESVQKSLQTIPHANFEVWCIEKDKELSARLRHAVSPYLAFATCHERTLQDMLPDIETAVASKNVFLYLDPFTVTGLSWGALDRVFAQVDRNRSVEVLINFNVFALARAGCVAAGKSFATDTDNAELVGESTSTRQTVSDVLGGEWWIEPFKTATDFPSACDRILRGYLSKLKGRFAEVCWHEIKEKHEQQVPNYVLAFGSRHPDGFELMNDAMAKSLKQQAELEAPSEPTLYEMRPETLVPDQTRIRDVVRQVLSRPSPRAKVILSVMRQRFGSYTRAEIRGAIEAMLKDGSVLSATGKTRINDDVEIRLKVQ